MKGLLLTIIIVIVLIPLTCHYLEQPSRYLDAYSPGLHQGNWVPNIFPNDITQIHEQHDIDTNEVWLRFTTTKSKIGLSQFKMLATQDLQTINISKPTFATWWFEGIIEQQPANDSALYAVIYKGNCGKNMVSYLAISKKNNINYWWCQYE